MCLILFAWRAHPDYPLIVAANRDEFHERPTQSARFWPDAPNVLAGRDLRGGGTWLGITRDGRFAALTNYREPPSSEPGERPSRGELVTGYLLGDAPPTEHARALAASGGDYDGFNLLLGTPEELVCVSNRREGVVTVEPGVHALSNHLLDTDWPKARFGRQRLAALVETPGAPASEDLLALLEHREPIGGEKPDALERGLAPDLVTRLVFIAHEHYGTRSSTALRLSASGQVRLVERSFAPRGAVGEAHRHAFSLERSRQR